MNNDGHKYPQGAAGTARQSGAEKSKVNRRGVSWFDRIIQNAHH